MTAPIDNDIEIFLKEAPLFLQSWWLEVVSPGAWNYVVARRGNEVAAVLPYTYKNKFNRWKIIGTPKLTPYLGPWLRSSHAKGSKRLSEEKALMEELIKLLPSYASFQMAFHPGITNWLPFYWKGFQQTTRYTYRIHKGLSEKEAWQETNQNIRTDIRKAERQVQVTETEDLSKLLKLHRLSFQRQNYPYPFDQGMILRMHEQCQKRGIGRILVAEDEHGRAHAGAYLVKDTQAVYYLLGGGDPELRSSGAASLILWKAIQWAIEQQLDFDFEGSMVEPIERFFRSFGGKQTPYFQITDVPSGTIKLYRAARQILRVD